MKELSGKQYLQRRGDTWHFRYAVPEELRPSLEKRELRLSLGTKDLDVAKQKRNLEVCKAEQLFSDTRKESAVAKKLAHKQEAAIASMLDIQRSVLLWFTEKAKKNGSEDSEKYFSIDDQTRHEYIDNLRDGLSIYSHSTEGAVNEREAWAAKVADKIIVRHSFYLPHEHKHYQDMVQLVLRADRELLERRLNHYTHGDFSGKSHDSFFAQSLPSHASLTSIQSGAKEPDKTLNELIEEFIKTKEDIVEPSTLKGYKAKYELLIAFLGSETLLSGITRTRMKEIAESLKAYPTNATKKYAGLSPDAVIAQAAKNGDATISYKNHKHYVESFSSLFSFAVDEEYITTNIAKKLPKLPKPKMGKKKRYPFTINQLNQIFATIPNWNWKTRHGKPPVDCIWVPIICLYTGMRVTECCQLHVDDIKQVDGIWYFDITPSIDPEEEEEAENIKHLKTEAANRKVPIPTRLIKLGYLKRVELARKQKEVRVLSEIPPRTKQ
ncbi:MAG: hypothetical protein P8P30_00580 [Rickettsiales bacterium]|nr:hypothetical protein [Rickettsiales bacterium]